MERVVILRGDELSAFVDYMKVLRDFGRHLEELDFWIDGLEGIKVKVNDGVWSPPYGIVVDRW